MTTPDTTIIELVVTVIDGALHAHSVDDGPEFLGELRDRVMPDFSAESGRGLPVIAGLSHDFTYSRDADRNHGEIVRQLAPSGTDR